MTDVTGWCRHGEHTACGGQLLTGTGHHWWCACPCHPEPPEPRTKAGRRALDVFRAARAALATSEGENTDG